MNNSLKTFYYLLKTDLLIAKKTFKTKYIDYCIQIGILISISAYIMPAFGLSTSYGFFEFAGLIGIIGMWEIYPDTAQMLLDSESDSTISYQLTLPISTFMIWIKIIIALAIKATLIALLTLPLGKLILWNKFNLAAVSPFKLITIIVLGSIFYSIISIWAVGSIRKISFLGKLWNRILFPLWFLGCFQFSFIVAKKLFPLFSYLLLLNPITYLCEASRATIIGQAGFLPFWLCIAVIILYSSMLLVYSLRLLRNFFDSVH